MLTDLTAGGLWDAQTQLISGHESRKRLDIYPHLSLANVEKAYQSAAHQSARIWTPRRPRNSSDVEQDARLTLPLVTRTLGLGHVGRPVQEAASGRG